MTSAIVTALLSLAASEVPHASDVVATCRPSEDGRAFLLTVESKSSIPVEAFDADAKITDAAGNMISANGTVIDRKLADVNPGRWSAPFLQGEKHVARQARTSPESTCKAVLHLVIFTDGTYVGSDEKLASLLARRQSLADEAARLVEALQPLRVSGVRRGADQSGYSGGTLTAFALRELDQIRNAKSEADASAILNRLLQDLRDYTQLSRYTTRPIPRH